jgi:hypothetical protein
MELNPIRREIRKLEDEIDKLTNGEFRGRYCRGLETYRIREFERLWNKYPGARELFRECMLKHKELYERLYEVPITDTSLRRDENVQNILKMIEKFGRKFSLADFAKTA